MAMDPEKEVAGIIAMVPKEYRLAPETEHIAAAALDAVDRRYGPQSDNPRSFHNAPHSVGVTRRSVRMANILMPYIRTEYRDRFYDLSIIDGATHDYDQDSGPGTNEENSALYAVRLIEEADGVLNTDAFKKRVPRGIEATKTQIVPETGEIIQVDLVHGSHDPIKFSMAFSDINGIAMEGSKRMWRDATNLYYEVTDEPTVEGLYTFLVNQAGFLSHRLNDGRVKADIGYYFADRIDEVFGDMHAAFHANIISAYNLAILLGKHPEMKHAIGGIAKAVDATRLGTVIGRVLTRELAADQ